MAAYDLSNFHEALRVALGDQGDSVSGYDYVEEQLNATLRTVVRMGMVPGLALASGTNPVQLAAEPSHVDLWALLVAQSALMMMGAGVLESIRTRAMSVSPDASSRREAVARLETVVANIEARGNVDDPSYQGLFAAEADVVTSLRFQISSDQTATSQ